MTPPWHMSIRERLINARVTGRRKLPPDDRGVFRLASNIGYGLAESVSDLVDNSVDAGARNVLVRVYQEAGRLTQLAVVDDGDGMDADSLVEAMRIGSTTKGPESLGKYGIGLKAASLGHTDTLTVISRRDGIPGAVRYTPEGIADGWKLDQLDEETATSALGQPWGGFLSLEQSGTIVVWEHMRRFAAAEGNPAKRFGQLARHLSSHLGLHFQRFLERELAIYIDLLVEDAGSAGLARVVAPLDPFPVESGHSGYPTSFQIPIAKGPTLELKAFIWPANSTAPGYKLDGKAAQRQGFYFYRNDRLVQAGGWNGWRNNDAEPHFSLARARLELPGDDALFGLNAQKNGIVPPPGFIDALDVARAGTTFLSDYVRQAEKTYRDATGAGAAGRPAPILSKGVSKRIRSQLADAAQTNGASKAVEMRWSKLPEDIFFEISPGGSEILLNQRYRSKVLAGSTASAADAPLVKTLLFLLLRDDLGRKHSNRKVSERHADVNSVLITALSDA